jgi:hypothetical protein
MIFVYVFRGEQPERRIYSAHGALRGDMPLSRGGAASK